MLATEEQLNELSLKDLKTLAQGLGIHNYYKLRKNDLVDQILLQQPLKDASNNDNDSLEDDIKCTASDIKKGPEDPDNTGDGNAPASFHKLDKLQKDRMVYGDMVVVDGVKYLLFVNNMFCNKCLVRIFLTEDMNTMLVVVYFNAQENDSKNTFHIIKRLDGPLYEENIRLGLPHRVAIKELANGQTLIHHHHRYESFIMDKIRYRIIQKTNGFAPDPSSDTCIVVHNQCYVLMRFATSPNTNFTNLRVFSNCEDSSKLGIFLNDDIEQVSRWIDFQHENNGVFECKQYNMVYHEQTGILDLRD